MEGDASLSGNRPPVIQSLTAQPSQLPVGATSRLTVVATDPDNHSLSYKWMASTGDIIGEGPEVLFSASFCCAGPNLITVTVRDNAGGTSSESIDVFIFY